MHVFDIESGERLNDKPVVSDLARSGHRSRRGPRSSGAPAPRCRAADARRRHGAVPADHRQLASTRPCSTCRGRRRWRSGRPSSIVSLPRGISRHLVRFARLSGRVVAVKEIDRGDGPARVRHAAATSRRLDVPCVEPVAVIAGRTGCRRRAAARPPSSPRTCSSRCPTARCSRQALRPDTANRLVDALAVLLVRLHNVGFFWGDVSLSNTLFRRDAGAFAAYLVDAETGELHDDAHRRPARARPRLARTNIAGEIMDLEAGGRCDERRRRDRDRRRHHVAATARCGPS